MIRELLPPGKRAFERYLKPDDLLHFCHPDKRGVWFKPFRVADEDCVVAGNGYLVLRLRSFIDTADIPEASPRQREALALKPSGIPLKDNPKAWGALDAVTLDLFKLNPRPIFFRTRDRAHFFRGPSIKLGSSTLTQLALVQLLSRLPRCEVYRMGGPTDPTFFRFNGGHGSILAMPFLDRPAALTIHKPSTCPLDGRHSY